MGIDYLSCKKCGEGFPDVADYVGCNCGSVWCDDECAKEDDFIEQHCSNYDVYGESELDDCRIENECEFDWCSDSCDYFFESSCKYCRKEDFDDSKLLGYLLSEIGKTREEIIQDYKESLIGGNL